MQGLEISVVTARTDTVQGKSDFLRYNLVCGVGGPQMKPGRLGFFYHAARPDFVSLSWRGRLTKRLTSRSSRNRLSLRLTRSMGKPCRIRAVWWATEVVSCGIWHYTSAQNQHILVSHAVLSRSHF